ncbi:MAG TPA: hypothetical protein VGL97_03845 [Bryobacteraceae bacterium]
MGVSSFYQILWLASALLAAAVIARIFQQRLFLRPLKSFAFMLAVVLLRDAILSVPGYDTHAYTAVWEWTLPAVLLAQIWVGLDTLKAVARLYPKIGKFAVRLFLVCLAITVTVCCVGLPFELHRVQGQEALLRVLFLLHRSVDSWIAGTLILVSAFFACFPAPLKQPPRNLVLHTTLLSLYFGGYAILFFAENLAPLGAMAVLEHLQFILVVLLYAAWTIFLSKRGQATEPWPQLDVMVFRPAPRPSS